MTTAVAARDHHRPPDMGNIVDTAAGPVVILRAIEIPGLSPPTGPAQPRNRSASPVARRARRPTAARTASGVPTTRTRRRARVTAV
ncbi:hypothetical protein APR04_000909 [Promicromonospora umidemergens]|nr:hypothetical protein [Promicromonospora umidemergens]